VNISSAPRAITTEIAIPGKAVKQQRPEFSAIADRTPLWDLHVTTGQIVKLALLLLGSAWLAYVSRASLRVPRSHGFYRFFAWECILILFLLNVGEWFRKPFAPAQLISWLLLIVSGFLVLHAVYLLQRFGRPDRRRQDVPVIGIEKTTRLVTQGLYRYVRHPLYSSLLFLAWGIFFKQPTWVASILGIAATGFLVATAKAEETESSRFFGPSYQQYMKQTKMFIPFLF
jgi:protein-S-isoprenylcysteine O-methyltransferase Ste14